MTGRSRQTEYRKLLIAPVAMKRRFIECIDHEASLARAGKVGRIIVKMNQLEDRNVTDALYRAGIAGVSIDLIVRGFCCLRPGVRGLSENIRVTSTIGRFLEHSRVFWFGGGQADPLDGEFYIGSADWMYRNLNTRVECAAPIEQRAHRERLWSVLQYHMTDRRQRWIMTADGGYELSDPAELPTDAQSNDVDFLGTQQRVMRDVLDARARESAMRLHS